MGRLFQFMDFNVTDFSTVYPGIEPGVGTSRFFSWASLNPGLGQFNWAPIHAWIEAEQRIKLADGSAKPLICFVMTHTAPNEKDARGLDLTPDWVKRAAPTVLLSLNGAQAVMPCYTSAFWWDCWNKLVMALGAEFGGSGTNPCNPAITLWAIGPGQDAECQYVKGGWRDVVPGGTEKLFNENCAAQFATWRKAFPTATLVGNFTPGPGGTRRVFFDACAANGIGFHWCGMAPDMLGSHGWGTEYMGTLDVVEAAKAHGLPVAAESTSGPGNAQHKYWGLLAAVAMGADYIDVHPDWLRDVPAERWNWITGELGKPIAELDEVWTVLRDYDRDERVGEYDPREWTSSTTGQRSGQSGWIGNWERGLRCDNEEAPRVWEEQLPEAARGALESRQCRLVRKAMFMPSVAWTPERMLIEIHAMNTGKMDVTFADGVSVRVTFGEMWGQPDTWTTIELAGALGPVRIDSDAGVYVHRVSCRRLGALPPEPEPALVDWAGMTALLDGVNAELATARGQAESAAATAHNLVLEAEQAEREANAAVASVDVATAELAELRAMMEAAQ